MECSGRETEKCLKKARATLKEAKRLLVSVYQQQEILSEKALNIRQEAKTRLRLGDRGGAMSCIRPLKGILFKIKHLSSLKHKIDKHGKAITNLTGDLFMIDTSLPHQRFIDTQNEIVQQCNKHLSEAHQLYGDEINRNIAGGYEYTEEELLDKVNTMEERIQMEFNSNK